MLSSRLGLGEIYTCIPRALAVCSRRQRVKMSGGIPKIVQDLFFLVVERINESSVIVWESEVGFFYLFGAECKMETFSYS